MSLDVIVLAAVVAVVVGQNGQQTREGSCIATPELVLETILQDEKMLALPNERRGRQQVRRRRPAIRHLSAVGRATEPSFFKSTLTLQRHAGVSPNQ